MTKAVDDVENVVGPVKALRMIRALANSAEPLTKYTMSSTTWVGLWVISAALRWLTYFGWVEKLDYKPKKYRLMLEKEKVSEFVRFLGRLGYA